MLIPDPICDNIINRIARDTVATYLGHLRETFANHPTYGNILLALVSLKQNTY